MQPHPLYFLLLFLFLIASWNISGCDRRRPSVARAPGAQGPTSAQDPPKAKVDHPAPATPATITSQTRYASRSIVSMATRVSMAFPMSSEVEANTALVRTIFDDIDARMSEWKKSSALSKINAQAGGEAVPVPRDLFELIERGVNLGRRTGGAFDITWAALWGLWNFRAQTPHPPAIEETRQRAALVDYRRVELDPATNRVGLKAAGMKIGLGGIAKGYALDRCAAELQRAGLNSFMLSAGGQVMVAGGKAGKPWRVGIRDPRSTREDYFAVISLRDGSVSTSGDYERFFIFEGRRYHHILDPRTGLPARGLRSATVLSADATDADALSTALMIMGRSPAMALIESDPSLEAVLVDAQGGVHVSSGLKDKLKTVHPPRP